MPITLHISFNRHVNRQIQIRLDKYFNIDDIRLLQRLDKVFVKGMKLGLKKEMKGMKNNERQGY